MADYRGIRSRNLWITANLKRKNLWITANLDRKNLWITAKYLIFSLIFSYLFACLFYGVAISLADFISRRIRRNRRIMRITIRPEWSGSLRTISEIGFIT